MSAATFTTNVYLPRYYEIADVTSGRCLPHFSVGTSEYYEGEGYPLIGTATITIELHDPQVFVQKQIDALNQQLQRERADSQVRQNAILERISKLQALEFSGVVV